jgi:hypothetical protein
MKDTHVNWDTKLKFLFWFLGVGWDWVHLVRRLLLGLLYQPRVIDNECGAVGGMRIGRGNRSTRRKPAPVLLRSSQISHDVTRARTQAAAVESRWLTAWAMARPPKNRCLIWSAWYSRKNAVNKTGNEKNNSGKFKTISTVFWAQKVTKHKIF